MCIRVYDTSYVVCCACRIQYDGMALHCLTTLLTDFQRGTSGTLQHQSARKLRKRKLLLPPTHRRAAGWIHATNVCTAVQQCCCGSTHVHSKSSGRVRNTAEFSAWYGGEAPADEKRWPARVDQRSHTPPTHPRRTHLPYHPPCTAVQQ